MIVSIIAAISNNGKIGVGNTLPWHIPSDLRYFKKTTMGCPVIMGRLTYDSVGRPLPGRTNIVISRNTDLHIEGCIVVPSLQAALLAVPTDTKEVFVIGGAQIYAAAIKIADRLYITEVNTNIDVENSIGFPAIPSHYKIISMTEEGQEDKDQYPTSRVIYEKGNI